MYIVFKLAIKPDLRGKAARKFRRLGPPIPDERPVANALRVGFVRQVWDGTDERD
jgi:hypothetical protein